MSEYRLEIPDFLKEYAEAEREKQKQARIAELLHNNNNEQNEVKTADVTEVKTPTTTEKKVTEPKELKIPEFMYETGTYREDKPKYEKPVIIVNEEHLKKVLEARKKYLEEKGE